MMEDTSTDIEMEVQEEMKRGMDARQMLGIWLCQLNEGMHVTLPYTLAVFMVRHFLKVSNQEAVSEQRVGILTGILAACFCGAQFLTQMGWGRVSDRVGRQPLLIMSNISSIISVLAFGLAPSYSIACAARLAGGLFNCTFVCVKTMIGEQCSGTGQTRPLTLLTLAWGVGTILGPSIGTLSQPCDKPWGASLPLCRPGALLSVRPFFLPCLIAAAISVVALFNSACVIRETLPRLARQRATPGRGAALRRIFTLSNMYDVHAKLRRSRRSLANGLEMKSRTWANGALTPGGENGHEEQDPDLAAQESAPLLLSHVPQDQRGFPSSRSPGDWDPLSMTADADPKKFAPQALRPFDSCNEDLTPLEDAPRGPGTPDMVSQGPLRGIAARGQGRESPRNRFRRADTALEGPCAGPGAHDAKTSSSEGSESPRGGSHRDTTPSEQVSLQRGDPNLADALLGPSWAPHGGPMWDAESAGSGADRADRTESRGPTWGPHGGPMWDEESAANPTANLDTSSTLEESSSMQAGFEALDTHLCTSSASECTRPVKAAPQEPVQEPFALDADEAASPSEPAQATSVFEPLQAAFGHLHDPLRPSSGALMWEDGSPVPGDPDLASGFPEWQRRSEPGRATCISPGGTGREKETSADAPRPCESQAPDGAWQVEARTPVGTGGTGSLREALAEVRPSELNAEGPGGWNQHLFAHQAPDSCLASLGPPVQEAGPGQHRGGDRGRPDQAAGTLDSPDQASQWGPPGGSRASGGLRVRSAFEEDWDEEAGEEAGAIDEHAAASGERRPLLQRGGGEKAAGWQGRDEAQCGAGEEEEGLGKEEEEVRWWKMREVVLTVSGYALTAFLYNLLDELVPIFASAPEEAGGLGFSVQELAVPLMTGGGCLILWALFGYPWLERLIGTMRACRLGILGSIPLTLGLAVPSLVPVPRGARLALLTAVLSVKNTMASNVFTSAMLTVNAAAPPQCIGAVNGAGQSLASIARGVGPALGGLFWSASVSVHMPAHQVIPFGVVAASFVALYRIYTHVHLSVPSPVSSRRGPADAHV